MMNTKSLKDYELMYLFSGCIEKDSRFDIATMYKEYINADEAPDDYVHFVWELASKLKERELLDVVSEMYVFTQKAIDALYEALETIMVLAEGDDEFYIIEYREKLYKRILD
ncbi:TPA: hypothetical protein KD834_004601 [Vibrio parahaemolyticus]|nr:hypothetical protein [Vibrio parahaemolyticus]